MLLQDGLGASAFTVHGFAQPAISVRQYQGSEVWGRAITTQPDVLAIMLGTMWKTDAEWQRSANPPSSTPRQRQIELRAAPSLG